MSIPKWYLMKWLSNDRQVAKQSGHNELFFVMKMKRFSFPIITMKKDLQEVGIYNKETYTPIEKG